MAANRSLLSRAVRFLAGEPGIRQFLELPDRDDPAALVAELRDALAPGSLGSGRARAAAEPGHYSGHGR